LLHVSVARPRCPAREQRATTAACCTGGAAHRRAQCCAASTLSCAPPPAPTCREVEASWSAVACLQCKPMSGGFRIEGMTPGCRVGSTLGLLEQPVPRRDISITAVQAGVSLGRRLPSCRSQGQPTPARAVARGYVRQIRGAADGDAYIRRAGPAAALLNRSGHCLAGA
jgi:hypothetical protein